MTAAPLGATPLDTGELLLGTVAVTPVFLESNGEIDTESQNWDPQEIDEVLGRISEGVNWWSTVLANLGTAHTLDFVIDDTYARDPFETRFEPIDRTSGAFVNYVSEFYTAQELDDSPSLERAAKLFNDGQRDKLDADWSFTIFIADSSDDPDGFFASGGQFFGGFAFPGGLFTVIPSTRPASTVAHELGHIFWARDEVLGAGSYTDRRGYYNSQNLNAADNPAGNQLDSILSGGAPLNRAFESFTSPASTLAFVGWQDSDNDGIFDAADVPLDLDVVGYFDSVNSTFNVSGTASAVPLINQNPSGTQSDITLNRISELQYRIDGGDWQVAAEPDLQQTDIDVSIPIGVDFETIEIRAIDTSNGVTSPIIQGTSSSHAITEGGIRGFTFLDENQDAQRGLTESLFSGTQVTVTNLDGSALFGGSVTASEFDEGQLPAVIDGVTLSAEGTQVQSQVQSLDSAASGNARVFQSFNTQREALLDGWNDSNVLVAEFDELVGSATVDAIGLSTGNFDIGSYARVEAYDSSGLLITRTTSELIAPGENASVTVEDPQGQIASIRVFGHASTDVAISSIDFGTSGQVTADADGSWQIDNLAAGQYTVEFSSQNVIFQTDAVNIEVSAGTSSLVAAAVNRVDSPRHNADLATDVNGDSAVTALDALLVINDISRQGSRLLTANETGGDQIDVTNDGEISALDALVIINMLNDLNDLEGEQISGAQTTDAAITEFGQQDPDEQYTNEPDSVDFGTDWLAGGIETSRLFNSAGQQANDESNAIRTTDTRTDGVTQTVFSSSFSSNLQQEAFETIDFGDKTPENTVSGENLSSLENYIESKLSEPSDELRV